MVNTNQLMSDEGQRSPHHTYYTIVVNKNKVFGRHWIKPIVMEQNRRPREGIDGQLLTGLHY